MNRALELVVYLYLQSTKKVSIQKRILEQSGLDVTECIIVAFVSELTGMGSFSWE